MEVCKHHSFTILTYKTSTTMWLGSLENSAKIDSDRKRMAKHSPVPSITDRPEKQARQKDEDVFLLLLSLPRQIQGFAHPHKAPGIPPQGLLEGSRGPRHRRHHPRRRRERRAAMSSTLLEMTRASHENMERFERLIVKDLQSSLPPRSASTGTTASAT